MVCLFISSLKVGLGSGHGKFLIISHRLTGNSCFQALYRRFQPRKEPYSDRGPSPEIPNVMSFCPCHASPTITAFLTSKKALLPPSRLQIQNHVKRYQTLPLARSHKTYQTNIQDTSLGRPQAHIIDNHFPQQRSPITSLRSASLNFPHLYSTAACSGTRIEKVVQ